MRVDVRVDNNLKWEQIPTQLLLLLLLLLLVVVVFKVSINISNCTQKLLNFMEFLNDSLGFEITVSPATPLK
jgi:hypothetical protein